MSTWTCDKATHGRRAVYDLKFHSYRCTGCGHRFSPDGPVKSTRRMWPTMWLPELRGRKWAMTQEGALLPRRQAK